MKVKKLVSSFLFLSVFLPFFSQSDASQLIIPKKLFVGDTAELRYSFRSSLELFEDNSDADEKVLPLSDFPYDPDNSDFTLTKLTLQRNGPFYTVVFLITPWRTGLIDIPSFDLLPMTLKNYTVSLEINPEPFEVSSILTNGEETPLKNEQGPLLVPGTVYILWLFIILLILLLILIIQIFVRRKQIFDFIKRIFLQISYVRNSRKALKELKKLELKTSLGDKDFCSEYQRILRCYLKGRLGYSFDSVSTRELPEAFNKATGGFLSEEREEKVEELEGNFYRTDYIRYAAGSVDSKRFPSSKYEAVLAEGERSRLINEARSFISVFETNIKSNGEKNV